MCGGGGRFILLEVAWDGPEGGGGEGRGGHFHTWNYWGCAAGQGAFLSFQLWHRVSFFSFRNWDRVLL